MMKFGKELLGLFKFLRCPKSFLGSLENVAVR